MRFEYKIAGAFIAALTCSVSAVSAQQFVAPIVDAQFYQPTPFAWTGAYVGVQGGLLPMKSHELGASLPTGEDLLGDIGGNAGVFAGYRYQMNDWLVWGLDVEANNDATELLRQGKNYGALKWDAAIRAQLGYPVAPNVLAYGSVGYSIARFDMSPFYSAPGYDGQVYSAGGIQLGVGVDAKVTDHIMARLLATWTHYGTHTITKGGVADGTSEPSVVNIRVGLGWTF
ncbi:outer membrane beta-barrel protein [Devosia sp.]|uniref:outer membrane protein n=1 Tax=Devosia sp. TaxID=1871048 RepID=UPI0032660AB3